MQYFLNNGEDLLSKFILSFIKVLLRVLLKHNYFIEVRKMGIAQRSNLGSVQSIGKLYGQLMRMKRRDSAD